MFRESDISDGEEIEVRAVACAAGINDPLIIPVTNKQYKTINGMKKTGYKNTLYFL